MDNTPPQPPPDTSGIHVGDVGGNVNFSALGDIVGGDKITNITTTIQISVEAITQRPLITASPYRGLDRFDDKDKDLFFGRDQLIKSLLAQLSASNVLLVLGASGSGKSSVVRAGLLPQLSQLIGARFRYFTFVPDVNPFESLRSALQAGGFNQTQTRGLLEAKPETPAELIHALQSDGDQWLLFVDQFEEIFTVSDEALRASFIAALVQIAQDADSSTKLVLAMRADFLDRFSPFPQFAKIIEKNIDFVADMHADELRQAIEQPAARHGVIFEQGLVEEIIEDVQGQAGSLPLLQYTLDLLWQEEAREDGLADRHLNSRAYRELGGVRGALQKRADEIYASFGDGSDAKAATQKQEIVRQIFLRLVDLAGESAIEATWRPVRRRVSMTIFASAPEQEILRALINHKLLVSNREGDDATVEVAHEALFTSWARLKNWIEAGKQVIFARNRLADDARRWQCRQQDDPTGAEEELLGGTRLAQALDMRARGDFVTVVGGLGETETQFLDASAALRDRRRQEEQERQQRELAQAQALAAEQKKRADDQVKATARQRRLTRVMIALVFIAAGVAFFAISKQKQATRAATEAKIATVAAQDALTRTFVRTIGVSEDKDPTTPDERAALWELSELDPASATVREKVIDHWLQTEDSLVRARRHNALGLHAAIGLNVAQRNRSAPKTHDLAERLTKALENQETNAVDALHSGDALNALAPWMEPKDATSVATRATPILARTLVTMRENDRAGLASLGTALEALAARIEPKDAISVADVLSIALENPHKTTASRSRILGSVLSALAVRMEPKDAAMVANRLAKALDNGQQADAHRLWSLSVALSALAGRMEPKDAALLLVARSSEVVAAALENRKENEDERLSSLGYALARLASKMESNGAARVAARGAQVLVTVLENPKGKSSDNLSSVGQALAKLATLMEPRDAASIAEHLVKALENPPEKDALDISSLGHALAALATRMEPKDVASIADRLAKALENSQVTDVPRLSNLSNVLAAVAARMESKDAARVSARAAEILAKALENPQLTSPTDFSTLGYALVALAARMEMGDAGTVTTRVAQVLAGALENPQVTDASQLSFVSDALAALAARMEPANAAKVAGRATQVLAGALENTQGNDTSRLTTLTDALAAMAARMEPENSTRAVARAAQILAKALQNPQTTDAADRTILGWSLGGLSRLIPRARQTQLAALSNLLLIDVSDVAMKEKEPEKRLAELYAMLGVRDLAEVLKWPFCVGDAQKIALTELEKKTGRTFDGDLWKFVERAPSLGIKDVDLPAKRPRIEDALNELKTFSE